MSEGTLQIAEESREVKARERERYTKLHAESQRIVRRQRRTLMDNAKK